jgi:hypothetical protein
MLSSIFCGKVIYNICSWCRNVTGQRMSFSVVSGGPQLGREKIYSTVESIYLGESPVQGAHLSFPITDPWPLTETLNAYFRPEQDFERYMSDAKIIPEIM